MHARCIQLTLVTTCISSMGTCCYDSSWAGQPVSALSVQNGELGGISFFAGKGTKEIPGSSSREIRAGFTLRGGSDLFPVHNRHPSTHKWIGLVPECELEGNSLSWNVLPCDDGFGQIHSDVQISSSRTQKDIWKLYKFVANRRLKRSTAKLRKRQLRAATSQNVNVSDLQEQRRARRVELENFFSRRERGIQARSDPLQRVAIDIGYPGSMTDGECSSLASQIGFCHGGNKKCELPLNLTVICAPACHREWAALAKFNPKDWNSSKDHGADVLQGHLPDVFAASECIYLSAEAEHELTALDPSKVYIVGGLVDRNRHKGAAARRAQALGMATAKLPVDRFVSLSGHVVLTVNHVVQLLQLVSAGRGWPAALREVLPTRKRPVYADQQPAESTGGADQDRSEATFAP